LFSDVADRLEETRREVNDGIAIWPAVSTADERHVDFHDKIQRLSRFHGDGAKNSVAWKRLRTAMDAWCALWFWPIDKTHLLPSRASFLNDIALVLEGKMGGQVVTQTVFASGSPQGRLFETVSVPGEKGANALFRTEERATQLTRTDLFGDVDVDKLIQASNWLPTAMDTATRQRFMHFDLEFADVMRERGGFDLVVGNPPWVKPAWSDPNVLSEKRPEIWIRGASAAQVDAEKPTIFASDKAIAPWYLQAYEEVGGIQGFISAPSNYPHVGGGRPNLYHCFVDLAFRITTLDGCAALIHQDAHLSEPRMKSFRTSWLRRISRHYQFRNELTSKMFAEINHSEVYSANIYRGREGPIGFDHLSGLYLPSTIDECYQHDGIGPVPGIKSNGTWDTRGHRKKIVRIEAETLALMSSVSAIGEESESLSRFIYLHSTDSISALKVLSSPTPFDRALSGEFFVSPMWDEGGATKRKRLMTIAGRFVGSLDKLIIKGPCIYVGNPLYKTPDEDCTAKEEFESIPLRDIPDDYVSRTNFTANVPQNELYAKSPDVPWADNKKHVDYFRIGFRRRVQSARERTLAAALLPPGIQHVDAIESMSFEFAADLLAAYPLFLSLPYDYLIKSMQLEDIRIATVRKLPFVRVDDCAIHRALRLACLTVGYADFWNEHGPLLRSTSWSQDNPRLGVELANSDAGLKTWSRNTALRSDFARRLALVEIDVLVAQALGLTIDELVGMYRSQFYVLEENEGGTWYDANGQIVWTCSDGLRGVGFVKSDGKKPSGTEWRERFADIAEGETLECVAEVDYLKDGPKKAVRAFKAPFILCDREADYRRAWAFFESELEMKAA
jgi:hypothetical protein